MIITKENIVGQLIDIYYEHENWHKTKMPEEDAAMYHAKLYEDGNIFCFQDKGEVLGCCEFWRLDYAQWGRIVCREDFSAYHENVKDGLICYVANVWIKESERQGRVFNAMKLDFYRRNFDAEYYVGEALRKKTQPIKVFKKSDLVSKLFKQGVKDG